MPRGAVCSLLLPALALTAGCCCLGAPKNYPVKGRVVSVKHEIVGSYLLSRTVEDLNDENTAVPNARIYLAYDQEGERPVPGYEAHSDKEGLYEIDTKDIPPAAGGGRYYLVVEKEGYEPVKRETGLGFMAPYITNTAVLKPTKQEPKEQP
jgi:hypothetical protein